MTATPGGAPVSAAQARPAIGVFGKVRAQGDFLRINASDPATPAFARFLEDGNEQLHHAGTPLGPESIGFVFAAPESGRALVGALGPGMDSVGRPYPLAIFAPVPGRDLSDAFPLVPALYRGFLQSAGALLREAPDLPPRQIAERIGSLPLPGPSDLAAAESIAQEARSERARELEHRLFGDPANGQHYYAFRTFQIGCKPVRGQDPGRINLALDCPCHREADASVWLDLARRLLQWRTPPTFFFRGGARPALVISLGKPPPAVLPFFAAAPRGNQKIWPLTTQQPAAVSVARKSLPTSQLLAIDGPNVTVGELIASLSVA
jgi:type VI secretion system protein ImpM